MRPETIARLEADFAEFPRSRAEGVPPAEIEAAALALGTRFPADYAEFLFRYGGAVVGPYEVFGLRKAPMMGNAWSVVDVTREFRTTGIPHTEGWVIVSMDHAGNFIGLAPEGSACTWDHDFGRMLRLADSFEDYLWKECLDLPD